MVKKSKNKKHKQIKVKKDFTKIDIAEKLAGKKVDKNCKEFYILFGFLWCEVLCEFVEVVENFCVKSFCKNCKKNCERKIAKEKCGKKLNKILSSKILK